MSLRILLALAAVAVAPAFAQTSIVTRTSDFGFPVVGLGSTETIGVNLINLAPNLASGTAASCSGSVTFYNSAGTAIGPANTFTLAANAATSINLAFSSTGITGTRGLIRAVLANTATAGVPCALSYSLNTFDTGTGATHLFLAGPTVNMMPLTPGPGR